MGKEFLLNTGEMYEKLMKKGVALHNERKFRGDRDRQLFFDYFTEVQETFKIMHSEYKEIFKAQNEINERLINISNDIVVEYEKITDYKREEVINYLH